MTIAILSSMIAAGAVIVAARLGHYIGHASGRDEVETEIENAAAAACPTCASLTESATRLELVGARVSGVEYFGHRDPKCDPIQDANWVIRVAQTHAKRVAAHAEKMRRVDVVVAASVAAHPDSRHRDGNGDPIT